MSHEFTSKEIADTIRDSATATIRLLSGIEDGDRIHKIRRKVHEVLVDELERTPYDPNFGDDKICVCDHPYERHFDSCEDNDPVGCKYCQCKKFREKP